MNDVTVIDRFLDTFSRYIDSGFGLLQGEVAFLTATLIVIDMTLAGLFWAMSHATGQGEDVIAKLIRKVLYVGAFAYIIGNFNTLAGIVFRSFAGLGLTASGSTLSMGNFLQPGHLAKVGVEAAAPIFTQIGDLAGFPEVFVHINLIVVLFFAWLVVIVSFFVLAVQLFVTLIEFKLTTLVGFVLVPFALWNKTAFLAEKVLGNVVSSGIKVLVLAVIVLAVKLALDWFFASQTGLALRGGGLGVPVPTRGLAYLRSDWRRIAAFSPAQGLGGGLYRGISQAGADGVWIASSTGKVERLDTRRGHVTPLPHHAALLGELRLTSVLQDRHGQLWIGHRNGLIRTDPRTGAMVQWTQQGEHAVPDGTSYSPALSRRSAPFRVAAARNRSVERITPAAFIRAAMAETPEPLARVTTVLSPCRADGPGA
mgnify:CR=1 FL=1